MSEDERSSIDMRAESLTGQAARVARQALAAWCAEMAVQRRLILQGDHTLVKRDPRDMASAIALGFVLVRLGLRAADSWKLEGLLSEGAAEVVERLQLAERSLGVPHATAGEALVRALDLAPNELAAKGEFEAWNRRAKRYFEEHRSWLAQPAETRESGNWRTKKMSREQQELIRQTCALLEIDLPGDLNRGAAHDWLARHQANLLYRGCGA